MWTSYSRSYSLGSISGTGPAGIDADDIHYQAHVLNKSVQRQLEEADRKYIELYWRHEKDKGQQMQSTEQRMTTIDSYF